MAGCYRASRLQKVSFDQLGEAYFNFIGRMSCDLLRVTLGTIENVRACNDSSYQQVCQAWRHARKKRQARAW
jgi:hypothetical protein